MVADATEGNFIVKIETEEARMIVCSVRIISVLATGVVQEFSAVEALAQAFEEALQVWLLKAAPLGETIVVVSKGDKAIVRMELRFVDAAHRPLS